MPGIEPLSAEHGAILVPRHNHILLHPQNLNKPSLTQAVLLLMFNHISLDVKTLMI